MHIHAALKKVSRLFTGLLFLFAYSFSSAQQFNLNGTASSLILVENTSFIYEFRDSESSMYQNIYVGSGIDPAVYRSYFTTGPVPTVVSISDYPTEGEDYFVRTASYQYFLGAFRTPGLYSLTVIKNIKDPIGAIYVSNTGASLPYDPTNPLSNLYAFSDDSGGVEATAPWTVYYNKTTSGCTLAQFLVYPYSGSTPPNVDYTISGPGEITSSCGLSATDTLVSFSPNAIALRNAFNIQSAKMAQGLSYDCSVFDVNNICVSFAGTKSDGKGFDSTTGALIIAHKPNANLRFGGYLDQAFNSSESGGLKVKRSDPGYGVFAVWSEKADGSGLQIRGSASFGKADIESTRTAIDTAEAGFGKSDIKSSGVQVEASRDYAVNALWSARPYVGYRQVTNRRGSYTESEAVDFPLTYSSIKQSTQSLLAGVRFAHIISAQTTMLIAAGLEHDIKNDVDRYAATNIDIGDIDSINMEDGKKKTRPTVSLGLNHVIDKVQRIGFSLTHRKEAFESGSTTSGMVQYSRGF